MSCSSILSKWRLWIHYVVMLVYATVVLMLLPNLIIHSLDKKFKKKDQSAFIGGLFVMMAIPIALWEITQHMIHYTKPFLQKHIIRSTQPPSSDTEILLIQDPIMVSEDGGRVLLKFT